MNHPVIDALVQLDHAAAQQFWNSEDRSVWKSDLLRQSETRPLLSLKKFIRAPIQGSTATRPPLPVFSTAMWDPDLRTCFGVTAAESNAASAPEDFQLILDRLIGSDANTLMGLLLRPGFWMTHSWTQEEELLRSALETARQNNALVIRNGFLTHEADILMTAELGFSGIQIHAGELDLYELQMAIELARDSKLCPIVSVTSPRELEQVLQTDAPHIALCRFPTEGHESALRFIQHSLPLIPNNCTRLLMTAGCDESEIQFLSQMGFQGIFNFGR